MPPKYDSNVELTSTCSGLCKCPFREAPVPNYSLPDLLQGNHKKEVTKAVEVLMNLAASEDLSADLQDWLRVMINIHMDFFEQDFTRCVQQICL